MTLTSIFIVPTLKIDKSKLIDNNFINAYIKDVNKEVQYKDAAYLVFKPEDFDDFQDFVNGEYDRTPHIIDDYDYDGGFVVLVYTLNPLYMEDFELVKQGKYSETSKDFQELFPKIVKVIMNGMYKDEVSFQHKVFSKSEDLKEYWEEKLNMTFDEKMEVWQVFNEKNEVLDIEKIKELI